MAIIVAKIDVVWSDAFKGYIPSKTVFSGGALYICKPSNVLRQDVITYATKLYSAVGILGATVMPHSLFLGSALATQDRISPNLPKTLSSSPTVSEHNLEQSGGEPVLYIPHLFQRTRDFVVSAFHVIQETDNLDRPKRHADLENKPLAFIQAHLYHGIANMAISLLGFAVLINSLCVSLPLCSSLRSEVLIEDVGSAS
jgi:metal iron transporter